jgi:hypothetical protein
VELSDADPGSAVINTQFTAVTFTEDGELYLMTKKGEKWSARTSICERPMGWLFDRSGGCLYYIERSGEDAPDGDLMAYRLSDSKATTLLYEAQAIRQTGAGLFVLTAMKSGIGWTERGTSGRFPMKRVPSRKPSMATTRHQAAMSSKSLTSKRAPMRDRRSATLCPRSSSRTVFHSRPQTPPIPVRMKIILKLNRRTRIQKKRYFTRNHVRFHRHE